MAIAFNVSGNTSGSATSWTITQTASGDDRLALLWVLTGGGDFTELPTIDNNDVTLIRKEIEPGSAQEHFCWAYVAPPASSVDYVVTASATTNNDFHALVYTGVNQSTTLDADAQELKDATPHAFAITTVAEDCWIVSMARNVTTGVVAPSTGTTGREDGLFCDTGDSNAALSAGANTMTWSSASGDIFGIIVSIAPAAAGSLIKSVNGLAQASIKSWNGVILD